MFALKRVFVLSSTSLRSWRESTAIDRSKDRQSWIHNLILACAFGHLAAVGG